MRRDHHAHHEHEDPLVRQLRAEYGRQVPHGSIEARVATLCTGPADGDDALSSEHLVRAEVASMATGPRARGRARR